MKYLVNVGIDWYGGKRAEPGEIREDIPKKSLPWLLEQGIVEPYDAKAEKAKSEGKAAPGAPAAPAGQGGTAETGGENPVGEG